MTRGKWRYEKSHRHHHVCIGEESYDINNESDARVMAAAKDLYKALKKLVNSSVVQNAPYINYSEAYLNAKELIESLSKDLNLKGNTK